MSMDSKGIHRFITTTLVVLFTLTSLPPADISFARDREERGRESSQTRRDSQGERGREPAQIRRQEREERVRESSRPQIYKRDTVVRDRERIILRSPRVAKHGHVVSKLPRDYRRVWRDKEPYYYSRGVFYRPDPAGFVVIGAPIGVVVVSLPAGYRRVWVDDSWYYVYGGVFYRRAPSGYVVVEAPPYVVIEDDIPVLIEPPEWAEGEVSVIADILNVRSGPGLRYPTIYQIHRGYILDVHGKTTGWLYVELPSGEFGWVMNIYTVPVLPPGSG